ncbi:asialoglycoprotein receptor 1-like [Aquarana catesbeiana]|uniref:asialoglycoprotein receptor 1-like n=1 Tax=Aquarana catesbeiana TaxID=8400 RepID=UPI003CC951A0
MIEDPLGYAHVTTEDIAEQFVQYFSKLYNLPPPHTMGHTNDRTELINTFLKQYSPLPITAEDSADLDHPITADETLNALKQVKTGKSPRPDALTVTKTFLKPHHTHSQTRQRRHDNFGLAEDVSDLQKSGNYRKSIKACQHNGLSEQEKKIINKDSGLTKDVSDLQKSVANITDDLNKIKLIINKGSSNPLCSEGWRHYGLSCYYLSSDSKPWNASKKECEDRKARLVVINSEEEMNFLRGIANKQTFWIGLTDADGTWRWVDGTSYDITPKFWEQNQPDDWTGHGLGGGEDCAALKYGNDWNDAPCSEKVHEKYICEKIIF